MTAAEIKAVLDSDHCVSVDRSGTEFLIMQDEGANGWHAWRTPVSESDFAVISFAEDASYPNGILRGDPDYSELAEEIAAWLAAAEVRA